jgi:hypothetical protein
MSNGGRTSSRKRTQARMRRTARTSWAKRKVNGSEDAFRTCRRAKETSVR